MAKTLDFSKLNAPVLPLVMMDDDQTVIKVSTPSEALVEELQRELPVLEPELSKGNKEAVSLCYDLAARLINHNRSFIKVTAEELRTKYHLDLFHLIAFFQAYIDFIGEIANAKN